jgi:hypothetical protein
MFVATFLTFMAIGGFPSFVEDMKVCCVLLIVELLITFKHRFYQKIYGKFHLLSNYQEFYDYILELLSFCSF